SLFCWTVRDVARERTDGFALEQMGCSVRYEDELGSLGESMLLRRWRALTGITPFHRVAEVYGDPQVTDEVFRHLGSLQRLRELGLSCTGVTDAGLASVGELDRLHILFLSKTSVTDAGLAHLKSLTELQALGLALTNITDEGL